ncbi:hypothetical protein IE4803_CH01809 [Rhizobium etli bv. phaseoli str. IE4803]|nr:hypothetical protein IE4803_CH01809 [Rhizobium etli bv. phaseoli str. IE4803]
MSSDENLIRPFRRFVAASMTRAETASWQRARQNLSYCGFARICALTTTRLLGPLIVPGDRSSPSISASRRPRAQVRSVGNDFYRQWLDPSMTYSSALYSTGANDLQSAQDAKYRALAKATGIRPGDHVLEIGCGWGGLPNSQPASWTARSPG